uniref:Uncharacterized protein n=1 Tax=Timema bartmani TaxID=61472 RepID=A0A7R9HVJ6_9NEOP|nr:unnamed protein product [Timema bartmani]
MLSLTAEDGKIEVQILVSSPMASLVLTDSSQLRADGFEKLPDQIISPMASLVLTDSSQLRADGFEKLPDQIMYPYAESYDLQKNVVLVFILSIASLIIYFIDASRDILLLLSRNFVIFVTLFPIVTVENFE